MYERKGYSYTETFLSSESMLEFYQKISVMTKITEKDNEILQDMSLAKKEIENNKLLLAMLKNNKLVEYNEKNKELEAIKAERTSVESEMDTLKQKIALLEQKEDQLESESKKVAEYISSLVDKKATYIGGIMAWPVPNSKYVTSRYGNRMHPIFGRVKFHSGVDIAASSGTSIVAANGGKVVFTGWQEGYGNTVIIDHGGRVTTLYAHCSKITTSTGKRVEAGETIAKVGSTGWSTGPHLHFEVRKGNSTVDPLRYVR